MRKRCTLRLPTDVASLAYMAGILDGEGTITIKQCKGKKGTSNGYSVQVLVFNTDEGLMVWLEDKFSGLLTEKKGVASGNRKCYVWWLSGELAGQLLEVLLPYLKIKAKQAELAIRFLDHGRGKANGRRHPADFTSERAGMVQTMRLLQCRKTAVGE